MPTYDLAWNRTRLTWSRRSESVPWQLQAILLERALIEGRPALRIVARLAGIRSGKDPVLCAAIENYCITGVLTIG